jgi:hypothetical protein
VLGELLTGWSEWGLSFRPWGSSVGQLVTESRFSMANLFSYQVRLTGPGCSLRFFREKPQIMLQSRLERGSRCLWCSHARVLTASRSIHLHPSLWWCPGVVVNPPAGKPLGFNGPSGHFQLVSLSTCGSLCPLHCWARSPRGRAQAWRQRIS